MRRAVWMLLAIVTLCGAALAQDIVLTKEEVRIPLGQSRTFDFGTVRQKDTTVLLDVLTRIDTDTFGGSSEFMKLVLNGRVVQAAKLRTAVRLINKKLVSPVIPNVPASWFINGSWRVLYAPDFEGALNTFYEGNPYQTVLDVTDLINPAAENRLQVFNTCAVVPAAGEQRNHDLVLKDLTIRVKPGASVQVATAAADQDVQNTGTPAAGPAKYEGKLLPGGGFSLRVGKLVLNFGSRLSYPNAGLNALVASDARPTGGQPGFTVLAKPTATGGKVIAAGPDYRVVRTVTFTARKVEVSDQVTNLHADAKLGLLVENAVDLKGMNASLRLAGNPDPAVNEYFSPPNPSVYAAIGKLGLGLICEDDVYRNQATLFFDTATEKAGLRTDKLCLQPGASYTLKWSVYAVAGPDYFDFINLVRQDWGSNFTVDGAWTVFDAEWILSQPIDKLRDQFARLGIRYAISNGSWHIGQRNAFGTGVFDEYWTEHRRRLREAAARIREAAPQVKILVYYDSQRDTSEGGEERFRDSWLTDREGNHLATDWGLGGPLTYSMVATLNDSFGRAMLAAVDPYLDETHSDGLYWDEMEGVCYGVPPIVYTQLDGHSCLLDPKRYTIEREVGMLPLLCESQLLAVIKRVRGRGGILMGNGPPFTRALLATRMPRMVETQHNDYWCYEGNLGPPLGYIDWASSFEAIVRVLRMACLPHGTNLNVEGDEITRHLFPFTPIELHAGYMLGQERIITLHSGNYGWPGQKVLVRVYHFDKDGKLTPTDARTRIASEARTALALGADEAAVLVRLPVAVRSGRGSVSVSAYGPEGLELAAKAERNLTFEIGSGAMTVKPGQRFRVTQGSATTTSTADKSGLVRVTCGGNTSLAVTPLSEPGR